MAILGSVLNSGYRAGLSGHVVGLPAQGQGMAESSLAAAVALDHRLPEPAAGALLRAVYDAYAGGMADVMLACTGAAVVATAIVALFLPGRGSRERRRGEAPEQWTPPSRSPRDPCGWSAVGRG